MIKPIKKSISFLFFIVFSNVVIAHSGIETSISKLTNYEVVITNKSIIPVINLSLTSSITQNKVLLNWSTTSEQSTFNFVVQRSSNNNDWENIGVVNAAGTSTITNYYSFIDEEPVSGITYYRLVQNDIKEIKNYSRTITSNYKHSNGLLKVYPNPSIDGFLHIGLIKNATVYIYSNSGSKLMEKSLTAGEHQIDVSKFAKGNYFIKMDKQTEGFLIQ